MTRPRTYSLAEKAPPPPDAGPAIPPLGLDLRLVPSALAVWATTAITLATSWAWLLLVVAVFIGAVAWRRQAPTVALPAVAMRK